MKEKYLRVSLSSKIPTCPERERRGTADRSAHSVPLKPLKTMGSADMAYPTKQCQLTQATWTVPLLLQGGEDARPEAALRTISDLSERVSTFPSSI